MKALIMIVFVLIIAGASANLLKFGITKWDYLKIEDSEVAGTVNINPNLIHIALSEFKGENLYLLEDEAVKEKLMQIPQIKDINVARIFPNIIKVIIYERIQIAYLHVDSTYYLIDEQGVLLDRISYIEHSHLPILTENGLNNLTLGQEVTNENVKNLLGVYKIISSKYHEFLSCIEELYYEDDELIITEKGKNTRFIVGDKDFDNRIEKLVFTYQNFGVASYSEIDVRFSDAMHELVILR